MREQMITAIQDAVGGCDRYWAGLIADGLINKGAVMFPYSIGQTVYIIRRPIDKPEWIDECVLEDVTVEYAADGKTCRFKSHNFEATEKDIGAWVFLTREEAEQALKERRCDND